jgi:hypothetical protein
MTATQHVRRLGQRTWLGTIHVNMDAARRELNYGGRQLLYRDIRALLARYEAEEARQGTRAQGLSPWRRESLGRARGTFNSMVVLALTAVCRDRS